MENLNDAHIRPALIAYFEHKGYGDKINRILEQGKFYKKSFRRITVVTTEKHLKKVLEIAPLFWGIILVRNRGADGLRIHPIRRTKINPYFDVNIALQTLWKSKMLELFPITTCI